MHQLPIKQALRVAIYHVLRALLKPSPDLGVRGPTVGNLWSKIYYSVQITTILLGNGLHNCFFFILSKYLLYARLVNHSYLVPRERNFNVPRECLLRFASTSIAGHQVSIHVLKLLAQGVDFILKIV